MSKESLPPEVETQVTLGLRTGAATGRIHAVELANLADAERQHMSAYGSAVVGIFMEQMGAQFKTPGWKVKNAWSNPETREGMQARRAVTKAVGAEIGLTIAFYKMELIGTASDERRLTYLDGEEWGGQDFISDRIPDVEPDKPFLVEHWPANNRTMQNFEQAVQAVRGMMPDQTKPDPAWFADLEAIRSL